MSHLDVIGLGISTVDLISLVDHLPAEDEVLQADGMVIQGGGPVATALVAAARLGAHTAMVDAVGDDWRGALIRSEFERVGVNTGHLVVRAGQSSSLACILVPRATGARAIVFQPGSARELGSEELPFEAIAGARALHVNGRHWPACLAAVQHARAAGVLVSFDGGSGRFRPELRQLVPLIDVCIVTRDFAEHFTEEPDIWQAGRRLLDVGPRISVITDGTRGSWVQSGAGDCFHQPAFLLSATVDTTGCGDAYHGAFLCGLLSGRPLVETARLASAVAALNARQLGGRAGLPDLVEVTAFIHSTAGNRTGTGPCPVPEEES